MSLTPFAPFVSGSYIISCRMEPGLNDIFAVRSAAGKLDELLLNYAPDGLPRMHRFRNMQCCRPSKFLVPVILATLPAVTTRPSKFSLTFSRKRCSTQFSSIIGKNWPSVSEQAMLPPFEFFGCRILTTFPAVSTLPSKFSPTFSRNRCSTQLRAIIGSNWPSGNYSNPRFSPYTPM